MPNSEAVTNKATENDSKQWQSILILFAHPMIHRSNVNKAMIEAVADLDAVTVHDLYAAYPELYIDVEYEQSLLCQHDVIIFHHPFYWYAPPAVLKVWQDLVLQHGFAFGREGSALSDKCFMSVVTCGYDKDTYEESAVNHYTVQELLRPTEQMARFTGMRYMPPYIVYGTHRIRKHDIITHADDYRSLLIALREGQIRFDDAQKVSKFNLLLSLLRGRER